MAECVEESTVSDENCPHRFVTATETVTVTGTVTANSDSNSDCDNEQANFTEHLGNTLWCCCTKCQAIPCVIECFVLMR